MTAAAEPAERPMWKSAVLGLVVGLVGYRLLIFLTGQGGSIVVLAAMGPVMVIAGLVFLIRRSRT